MSHVCIVLAGGEGRRVRAATGGILPKPMLNVAGLPFLFHKLNSLRFLGFSDALVLTGHHAPIINEYLATLKLTGLRIRTLSDGPQLLGTGGGIYRHLSELPNTFWVTYADSITVCDISSEFPRITNSDEGVMTVRDNRSGHEVGNVDLSDDFHWVTRYEKVERPSSLPWIDFGLLRLSKSHFSSPQTRVFDLSVVLRLLVETGRLRAVTTDNNYFDIGTLESYKQTCHLAAVSGATDWWAQS